MLVTFNFDKITNQLKLLKIIKKNKRKRSIRTGNIKLIYVVNREMFILNF